MFWTTFIILLVQTIIVCLINSRYYNRLLRESNRETNEIYAKLVATRVDLIQSQKKLHTLETQAIRKQCNRCKRYLPKGYDIYYSDGVLVCPVCFKKHLDLVQSKGAK